MNYQIKCVNTNAFDDITHIGGDGFKFTLTQAIEYIESGKHVFFTKVLGYKARIYVTTHSVSGKKFLKTTADTTNRNNLNELPTCP